jgi:hypothetical protein
MTTETSRDLDARVESVLFGRSVECIGGRWLWVGAANTLPGSPYMLPDGREAHPIRNYSGRSDTARLVEDEIERRGLTMDYADALVTAVAPLLFQNEYVNFGPPAYAALWALIRATPEQRCRAALAAVGEG